MIPFDTPLKTKKISSRPLHLRKKFRAVPLPHVILLAGHTSVLRLGIINVTISDSLWPRTFFRRGSLFVVQLRLFPPYRRQR